MKNYKIFRISSILKATIFLSILIISGVSCELTTFEDLEETYYNNSDVSITQYIVSREDTYSILSDVLAATGLNHLFKTYGNYTFFAPTDSAFTLYFQEKGKSSYEDFEVEELKELIKYHVFLRAYKAGDLNMGIIETKTLSSDYMVSSPTADGSQVLLNKTSKIIYQNNLLPNGILHGVDRVLEKPTLSILDWLTESGNYSIIIEALELSGLNQLATLNADNAQDFYSCFFTPDEVYAQSDIKSFAELANFISPDDDNYEDPANTLNIYLGSHFLDAVVSMSNAREDIQYFGTIGGASVSFGLVINTAEVVLNSRTFDFPEGLNVNEFISNNLVSNGIIHVMDEMYQITSTFQRITREFPFLDVPGIPFDSLVAIGDSLADLGIKAEESTGERYWPKLNGPNHLPFDKTAPWLTLNSQYSGKIRSDAHRNQNLVPMFIGFDYCNDLADFTLKIPYVIPGKYILYHWCKAGKERPTLKHYFNGEQVGGIVNLSKESNEITLIKLGIIEIKEEDYENSFRVEAITPGYGLFIGPVLVPVD